MRALLAAVLVKNASAKLAVNTGSFGGTIPLYGSSASMRGSPTLHGHYPGSGYLGSASTGIVGYQSGVPAMQQPQGTAPSQNEAPTSKLFAPTFDAMDKANNPVPNKATDLGTTAARANQTAAPNQAGQAEIPPATLVAATPAPQTTASTIPAAADPVRPPVPAPASVAPVVSQVTPSPQDNTGTDLLSGLNQLQTTANSQLRKQNADLSDTGLQSKLPKGEILNEAPTSKLFPSSMFRNAGQLPANKPWSSAPPTPAQVPTTPQLGGMYTSKKSKQPCQK